MPARCAPSKSAREAARRSGGYLKPPRCGQRSWRWVVVAGCAGGAAVYQPGQSASSRSRPARISAWRCARTARHLRDHLGVDLGRQRRRPARRRHADQSLHPRAGDRVPRVHRRHLRRRRVHRAPGRRRNLRHRRVRHGPGDRRHGMGLGRRQRRPAGQRAIQHPGDPAGEHDGGRQRDHPALRRRPPRARAEAGRHRAGLGLEPGQLGNGTTTDPAGPVQVTGLTNATQVAAGERFSLAVHTVLGLLGS
jgi:Regulator of chromosome condensation (RCC1) repeat